MGVSGTQYAVTNNPGVPNRIGVNLYSTTDPTYFLGVAIHGNRQL
jgi:hypothetical protein